jgi:hypothetical protein
LLDRRNIYVEDAIAKLAKIIERSVREMRADPSAHSQSSAGL